MEVPGEILVEGSGDGCYEGIESHAELERVQSVLTPRYSNLALILFTGQSPISGLFSHQQCLHAITHFSRYLTS